MDWEEWNDQELLKPLWRRNHVFGPIAGLLAINVILLVIFLFSPRNASRRKTWFFSACSSLSRECPRLFIKWLAAGTLAIYGINSHLWPWS